MLALWLYFTSLTYKFCDDLICVCDDGMDLLEEWYSDILKTNQLVQDERVCMFPFLAVPTPVVDLIFLKCGIFNQPNEVRYLSVELFDRFIRKHYTDLFSKVWKHESNTAKEQWKRVESQLQTQTTLRMLSCIQLASKFVIHTNIVRPKGIRTYLKKEGKIYTLGNILSSELRVWKTLGFKMNIPTILTYVDLILEHLQATYHLNFSYDTVHKRLVLLIDFVYLHHQEIYRKLFYISTGRWDATSKERNEFISTECNYLYVSAAIIALAFTFTVKDVDSDNIYNLLSIVTQLSVIDIQTLSQVINQLVLS